MGFCKCCYNDMYYRRVNVRYNILCGMRVTRVGELLAGEARWVIDMPSHL